MASLPFALSIHHFISSVGADAGFAAIIGLAILILLYFAQARETAALRTHADEAAKRIRHLEGRLAALSGAQTGARQPEPKQATSGAKATAAAEPSPAAPRRGTPGAPAGVAAPALAAATRLIPSIAKRAQSQVQAGGPAVALAEPPAGRNGPGGSAGANGPRATSATATSPSALPPATAAGAANGTQNRPRPAAAPLQAQPRTASAAPANRAEAPADTDGRRSLGWPRITLAALVVAAVVVALLLITGSSSGPSTGTAASSQAGAGRHRTAAPRVAPSSVTVAVLNGTAVTGLAHRVALRLTGAGYREGTVATATDQTHPTTIVAYLPGFRRDALAVAHSLKVRPAAVQAVDQSSRAVACPPPSACTANVVVTVGTDLANTP